MKKLTTTLLLLTWLLTACSNGIVTTEVVSGEDPAPIAEAATPQSDPIASASDVPAREALISEIENIVSARNASSEEIIPATLGMKIGAGGGIETGDNGRVRVDLLPDGTIIRLGPNSSFNLPEITEIDGQPKTTIQLLFGKIYVLLKGGSLDVQTPSGVASVRGSVLSVEYDPETQRVTASCLEGHCALEDEEGREVELNDGEGSYIDFGEAPLPPEEIDQEEILDWLDQIPEIADFFDELPNPEDFPESSPEDEAPNDESSDEPIDEEPPPSPEG